MIGNEFLGKSVKNSVVRIAVGISIFVLLAVALPASAAIQATTVEIRGSVANDNAAGDFSEMPQWDANTFAGFYYDLKNNRQTEHLQLLESINTINRTNARSITKNMLWYNTTKVPAQFKVNEKEGLTVLNSSTYPIVGWQAEKYVAVNNKTYKLAKLVFEMNVEDKKTLTIGETWTLGAGYELTINSVDASSVPRQVWFTLKKDGSVVYDGIIQASIDNSSAEKQKAVFTKTVTILGESDSLLFTVYVDSIFSSATSDMVQFKYGWLIDASTANEIKSDDVYGVFKVRTADDTSMSLSSDGPVSLSRNSEATLMGNMKIRTADNDTLRFYPFVVYAQPGNYEVRGNVIDQSSDSTAQPFWDAQSFAGFYYDLKNNRATETLSILQNLNLMTRTIPEKTLFYNTTKANVQFKVNEKETNVTVDGDATYPLVGWQAEKWIAVKNVSNKLAKLVFEMEKDDKKTLTTGETWTLGSGYEITINAVDAIETPRQVWFTLKKDGAVIDEGIGQAPQSGSSADKQKAVYFKKLTILGESDALLFTVYVDSIFSGATSDMVQFKYGWLIDQGSAVEIKTSDTFGVFEVTEANTDRLVLWNKNSVSLSKNTETTLMGNMKFRTADNDTLRFYPKVDFLIGGEVLPSYVPYSLSISINHGDVYTGSASVNLTIFAVNATNMSFSNDGLSWGEWEPYSTTKSWTLTGGEGSKTVYFKARNNAGEAIPVSDTIILETRTQINNCTVISKPGEYVLTKDVNADTTCIEITSSDVVLDGAGHSIYGTGASETYGVYAYNLRNITVKNLNMANWIGGIQYYYILNGNISNNNASNNSAWGILLVNSSNITLSGNNASNNRGDGIGLYYSSNNNTISGNNASNNNATGIQLDYCSNNTLSGNNANSNTGNGITIQYSDYYSNNTMSDNNASNNYIGIWLYNSSSSVLHSNTANLNTGIGIYLANSINSFIYNNNFNNTDNFAIYNSIDTWNITNTEATNIIGGLSLGGNFWANPDGTGFSQTCKDADGDGICDSPYTLDANNIDYLPLSAAQSVIAPNITGVTPASPITTEAGTTQTFSITIDQPVNVTWLVNGIVTKDTEKNVMTASYTNVSSAEGTWNVTAGVSNSNGSNMRSWTWVIALPSVYIPPSPANITSTQGNFWINYTWQPGGGNATDSYNLSVNGIWTNGTIANYINSTKVGPHGWSNITVYAYNASGTGSLSLTPVNQSTQVANNVPVQAVIENKTITAGTLLTFNVTATDMDNDTITYDTNAINGTNGTFNKTRGTFTWQTNSSDIGTYVWYFNSSDGLSVKSETITIVVRPVDEPPSIIRIFPVNNSENITGSVNVTVMLDRAGNAYLNWNGGQNEKMDGKDRLYYKNITGINYSGNYSFKIYANVSGGIVFNESETRIVTVNRTITLNLIPNSSTCDSTKENTSQSPGRNATVTIFNCINATLNGTTLNNITVDSLNQLDAKYTLATKDTFVGENLSMGPDGALFTPGIKLRFYYKDENIPSGSRESDLVVKYFNESGNNWEALPITNFSDTENWKEVTASHFTFYGLFVTWAAVPNPPAASSSGGSGVGTGGYGLITKEPAENIEKFETKRNDLVTSSPVDYDYSPSEYGIYEIVVNGKKMEDGVSIRVELLKGLSKMIKDPAPEVVHYYTNVWAGSQNIKEVLIRFKEQNSWIASQNLGTLKMLRWNGSEWESLETKEINKDDKYTYFEARSNKLSQLAVVGEIIPPIEASPTAVVVTASAEVRPTVVSSVTPSAVSEPVNWDYIPIIFAIILGTVVTGLGIIPAMTRKSISTEQFNGKSPEEYGAKYQEHLMEQYKTYVASSDKANERRQTTTNYFLMLNSILVSAFGILSSFESMAKQHMWQYLLIFTGLLVSITWGTLASSSHHISSIKHALINEIETKLPASLYSSERKIMGKSKGSQYSAFAFMEQFVPWIFAGLYILLLVIVLRGVLI